MASRPRRIAAAEWDSHKETILNLRQSGVSIKGEDGIVARLEGDYEFTATPAQYELQLSKWGARKNINANEWRATLQAVDQYNENGFQCAVYKNGELVRPLTLQKKRNQHCKGQEYARLRRSRAGVLPECIEIKTSKPQTDVAGIMDLDGDEDSDEGSDENALSSGPYNLAVTTSETTSETTPVATEAHVGAVRELGIGEPYIGSQMSVSSPFLDQSNQTMGPMSALTNDEQIFETSITNSTSELLPDTLDLTMDHVPMDHDSTLDVVSLVRGNPATRDTSLIGPDTPLDADFIQALDNWWDPNMQSPSFNENLETRGYQSLGASPQVLTQQAVVHRQPNSPASRDAGEPGGNNARQLVTDTRPLGLHGSPLDSNDALLVIETIGLKLSSLLISDDVSSNPLFRSRTVARYQIFDVSIYGSLILSIENNFAGLDGMPIGAVSKFLEQGPQMRSQLSKYLRALPMNISKTVAESLIRAAIENCDAPMVTELLKTGLVAPNDIVCSFNGYRYTAVERSASLNSIEVTKVLLMAGADINKGYPEEYFYGKGALDFAIKDRGKDSPIDMHFIRMLLDHGAEVRVRHAIAAVESQEPLLIQAIMSSIPAYDHPYAFRPADREISNIMEDAVRLLDSELATSIIEQIVQACYQTNCGKCTEAYPDSLQNAITLAARRGYSRLVAFLADYVTDNGPSLEAAVRSGKRDVIELLLERGATNYVADKGPLLAAAVRSCKRDVIELLLEKSDTNYVADTGPPLAAAVRSGKRDIIELLLQRGANPDAPTCYIDNDGILTTPFAEAIRAEDDELIRMFHELGATTHISEEGRFEAAIFAASEAGRLAYVNELLQMAPGVGRDSMGSALYKSIKKGHEEIALTLLKAGADVHYRSCRALYKALHQKNKTLVLTIMECDLDLELVGPSDISPLEAATHWGDVSIIKDLLSMGTDINACTNSMEGTAVTVAVRAKNRPLVEFFVENGARIDVPVDSRQSSPLMVAISNKDLDMMQYLLDLGADPSCSHAINKAVEIGGEILAVVLDACRIKFPKPPKGLGAKALLSAIERNDVELVDILLAARFDVNTLVETRNRSFISALGMAIVKTSGSNLGIIRKLILAGGDPNSIVSSNSTWKPHLICLRQTAILEAILTKSKPLVELLIDEDADIERAARLGLKRTPLQQACEVGAMEIVDLLLEKGADVNEAPVLRGGATSLQLCAIKGFCGLAEKLLNLGANVHAVPSEVNGRTALDGAAENGRLDMLMLLWNATANKRFSPEQCSHAMKLAEENGHIACCDLLRQLDINRRDVWGQGRLST